MPFLCYNQLVKSVMAATKAYQSPSGKGEVFLADFKLCVQQPHFGKCKLEEKEQSALQAGKSAGNIARIP